jgi:molybdopterin-guanine dinucleotide biosynthesis protein A
MKVLGAILAGGLSTRFGSDKALATIDGRPLIDHALDALRPQVDAVVVCGREWPRVETIADRPAHRIGPLGGLNAALHHAVRSGCDAVLCVPVDIWPLPGDLHERLVGHRPAVFDRQYLIGFWPAHLELALDEHIARGKRSVQSWITASSARAVRQPEGLTNLNEEHDLRRVAKAERPR